MAISLLLAVPLILVSRFAFAGLFPEDSLVRMIGHKDFKAAMKENMTSVVAFVTPRCEDCQRMVTEYSNAALGLYPLVPLFAVDCSVSTNKRLCADNDVNKFPTVKLFPRGKYIEPKVYNRTQPSASEIYYFAQYGVPDRIKKIHYFEDMYKINEEVVLHKHRALLMKRTNKMPLVWPILANKHSGDIEFFSHRDWRGRSSVRMGFEAGEEMQSKVLIFPAGQTDPVQFKGVLRYESLSKLFDFLLEGVAGIEDLNEEAASKEFVPDPELLEIERKQEAEMLKLAHGGFADLVDFEAAIRDGSAKNFHGNQGYPRMMGDMPVTTTVREKKLEETGSSRRQTKKIRMPLTDEAGTIVLDVLTGSMTPTSTATQWEGHSRDEL